MKISPKAEKIIARLNQAGFEAYLVGGCVRDLVMGKEPTDWDITTNAKPEETMEVFSDFTTIPTGLSHGTVTVLDDHEPFEITTYRTEGTYTDHRRPDSVNFVTNLREDLSRRDFTINAMAYHPRDGLVDLFGGMADIEAKIIRTVGLPRERFAEDALRIMRALRFAATLGFEIERETLAAAEALAKNLEKIAIERITAEFLKLICGDFCQEVLKTKSNILGFKVKADKISQLSKNEILRLAFLFSGNEVDFSKLRLPKAISQSVRKIWAYKYVDSRRLIRDLGDLAPLYLELHDMDICEYEETIAAGVCCTLSQLAIDGKTIMEMGFEGRKVGDALEALLDAVMDGKAENTEAELIKYLSALSGKKSTES